MWKRAKCSLFQLILLVATAAVYTMVPADASGQSQPRRPGGLVPIWVRQGDAQQDIDEQLDEISSGDRVLIWLHGGGLASRGGIERNDFGLVERLNREIPFDQLVVFDFTESDRYKFANPTQGELMFVADRVKQIARRAGGPPDAVCFSAGAATCRASLRLGARFDHLVLVEDPVDLAWVDEQALNRTESGAFNHGYNVYFEVPSNESVPHVFFHGAPIEGFRNVNWGPWRHDAFASADVRLEEALVRAMRGEEIEDRGSGDDDDEDYGDDLGSIGYAPPFFPPGGPPGGGASGGFLGSRVLRQNDNDTRLGGIDFTEVRLRYLSDWADTTNPALAFTMDAPGDAPSYSTVRGARTAWDAFFVWLGMDPSTFWVNLNPAEPDRVIDAGLRETDVGRILLSADFEMKRTVGRLIHPDSVIGRAYWEEIGDFTADGPLCFSFRQWIVPAGVSVWSDETSVYVLEAELDVKLESEYLGVTESDVALGCESKVSPAKSRAVEAAFRRLVLPEVVRRVNHAPEYAELRVIFHSLVVAEWYRDNARGDGSAFSDLVDRGHARDLPAVTEWRSQDIFDAYVRSIKEGEFRATRRVVNGRTTTIQTFVYGGVDFTRLPVRGIQRSELDRLDPDLNARIVEAVLSPSGASHGDQIWLGGVYMMGDGREATGPGAEALEGDSHSVAPVEEATASKEEGVGPSGRPLLLLLFVGGFSAFLVRRVWEAWLWG